MNAQELFHQDGKAAGIYYCGECRIVSKHLALAEQCCVPRKCTRCQCELPKNRLYMDCDDCRQIKQAEAEAARFAAAEKVTEWEGPVFLDGASHNEGYFNDLGEFYDWLANREDDEEGPHDPVTYVWACHKNSFIHYDVSRITENLEGWEEWDGHTKGEEELQAALDAWAEKNKDAVTYSPDYKRAVLLSKSNPELTGESPVQ